MAGNLADAERIGRGNGEEDPDRGNIYVIRLGELSPCSLTPPPSLSPPFWAYLGCDLAFSSYFSLRLRCVLIELPINCR